MYVIKIYFLICESKMLWKINPSAAEPILQSTPTIHDRNTNSRSKKRQLPSLQQHPANWQKNCSPGCDANVAPVNHRSSPFKSRSIIQYVRPHTIEKLGVYAQKTAPFKACAPHSHRHRNMPQIRINSLSRVLWLEMILFMLFLISFVCESVGFIFWPFIINDCCIGQLTDIF